MGFTADDILSIVSPTGARGSGLDWVNPSRKVRGSLLPNPSGCGHTAPDSTTMHHALADPIDNAIEDGLTRNQLLQQLDGFTSIWQAFIVPDFLSFME